MSKDTGIRVQLRSRDGVKDFTDPKFTPELALSLAITRASRPDASPGTWTVMEWGEDIYRITRHEAEDAPHLVTIELV